MRLNHINHDKLGLLIFFGGFYTDYNCFEEFDTGNFDILFVNDYSKMDFSGLRYFDFTPYTEINAIAYSYGVWGMNEAYMAGCLPEINKSVAISGTFYPVHPEYGINPKVFNIMLNALSVQTMANFERNMLANSGDGTIKKAERTIENLRAELLSIKNAKAPRENDWFNFSSIILTKNDKIFPFRAQEAFWKGLIGHNNITVLETGHFPFFQFETLDNILEV